MSQTFNVSDIVSPNHDYMREHGITTDQRYRVIQTSSEGYSIRISNICPMGKACPCQKDNVLYWYARSFKLIKAKKEENSMKALQEIRDQYQLLVNKTLSSIKEALEKKDFALLDLLRVAGETIIKDMSDQFALCEIVSEEQALSLNERWEIISKKIDDEEEQFTTRGEDLMTKDLDNVHDMLDEGWGG